MDQQETGTWAYQTILTRRSEKKQFVLDDLEEVRAPMKAFSNGILKLVPLPEEGRNTGPLIGKSKTAELVRPFPTDITLEDIQGPIREILHDQILQFAMRVPEVWSEKTSEKRIEVAFSALEKDIQGIFSAIGTKLFNAIQSFKSDPLNMQKHHRDARAELTRLTAAIYDLPHTLKKGWEETAEYTSEKKVTEAA